MTEGFGGFIRRAWRSPVTGASLLAVALLGCATTTDSEPRIVIQEKVVAVTVPCTPPSVAPAPTYPDSDEALKQASPAKRYALIIAGRLLRIARQAVTEPVVEGCRK